MDSIPKNKLLVLKPDTVHYCRSQYNLENPEQIKQAVSIIHEWVQQQKHFKKKDFSPFYYETHIVTNKGSLERTKKQIDTICTMRTLLPRFFDNINVKTDLEDFHDYAKIVMLPKLTDDHYRVDVVKLLTRNSVKKPFYMYYFKYNVVYAEYVRIHDYANGFIVIFDLSEINLASLMANLNLVDVRQAMSIYVDGYGMRIKGIHMISTSKLIGTLVAIVKQVVSPKVAERIYVHNSIEGVYEHIPKSILPKDYGGEERSMKELQKDWLDELSSEEHMKYMREMNAAGTDESYRQKDEFNDQYAGMPGTFRLLTVD